MTPTKLLSVRTYALHFALSALLLMLLAACGGSDGSSAAAATPTGETAANTGGGEGASTNAGAFESDSPIDNMIGVPVMDELAMNDYVLDVLREGEFKTAECMLASGFEYSPVLPNASTPSADEVGPNSAEDYAKSRGFGIVAQFNESQFDPADPPVHPNQTYRASLSEAEYDAYEVALYGSVSDEQSDFDNVAGSDSAAGSDSDSDTGQGEDDGFPGATGGCKALASEELFSLFTVLDEFTPDADAVFDAWFADPRVLESNQQWLACMNEEGFTIDDPDPENVREEIFDRLDSIMRSVDFGALQGDASPPRSDPRDNSTQFLSGDYFGPVPKLDPASQAKIDELGTYEIELATANVACKAPRLESDLEIQYEYEQQLVDSIGPALSQRLNGS